MESKKLAGEKAVEYIKDGMIVGLGTGSTVYWTILKIGELIKQGLKIHGVPTSKDTEQLAVKMGIPLLNLSELSKIDLTIDGADEVNPRFDLIKGGGGALLREKMIASISERFVVVADETKYVTTLGKFPLPVEVTQFGWEITKKQIERMGQINPQLRLKDNAPYITDNGNFILDCYMNTIEKPEVLSVQLNMIPGVVENGLFVNMADTVIIGGSNGEIEIKHNTI
ncbi:ribose-5-phosphate isomerase RpiA [Gottfriedia solisilvae]|uniref:Ribose-5-phosphate isomerase A n=1 Tax=Gottfriedia solisilvae TaxID=1516104 RepID=A0A8J3ANJ1_9BACI|nr:ribose-5-phosphate isomerase RpiA [Gottfriedia solisilvae]GGI17997.1 ribose-5-phosphate isomerase A [Gottfriedia solisilvae]